MYFIVNWLNIKLVDIYNNYAIKYNIAMSFLHVMHT